MASYARFGTHNQVLPKEGPICVSYQLDFRTTDEQPVDLTLLSQNETLSFVQGFFCDNSQNANPITIQVAEYQRLIVPAGKQAYLPAFVPADALFTLTTPQAGTLVVPFIVTNVPVMPCVW